MVVKLWNISDWEKVDSEQLLLLDGKNDQSRKIRLEVNASWPTRVSLMIPGQGVFHLAVVQNVETIEFWYRGQARLSFSSALPGTDEVEAWVYTSDGQRTSFALPDAETFTKIAQRRARNPELEWMQYQMMQNIERRLEQQAEELHRRYGADPKTGEIDDGTQDDGDGAGQGAAGAAGDVPAGGQQPAGAAQQPAAGAQASGASASGQPAGGGAAGDGRSPVPAPD